MLDGPVRTLVEDVDVERAAGAGTPQDVEDGRSHRWLSIGRATARATPPIGVRWSGAPVTRPVKAPPSRTASPSSGVDR